jgi:hypothetical protein
VASLRLIEAHLVGFHDRLFCNAARYGRWDNFRLDPWRMIRLLSETSRLQRTHYLGGVVFVFGGNEHLLVVAFAQLVLS